jgi:hypothetical protein
MRTLVFDTSSIISLATNNLLSTLEPLKKQFNGRFLITQSVHQELIENPLNSKRYKLEALMIEDLFKEGILEVYEDYTLKKEALKLLDSLNRIFTSRNQDIKILDLAEVESFMLAKKIQSEAYVVDERTIRLIVENPNIVGNILKKKLHTKININFDNLQMIKKSSKDVKIIRSIELMLIAYKMRLFDKYTSRDKKKSQEFLDGLLWALKLHGASITEDEINQLLNSRIL